MFTISPVDRLERDMHRLPCLDRESGDSRGERDDRNGLEADCMRQQLRVEGADTTIN